MFQGKKEECERELELFRLIYKVINYTLEEIHWTPNTWIIVINYELKEEDKKSG
jgi:hypothetical protein